MLTIDVNGRKRSLQPCVVPALISHDQWLGSTDSMEDPSLSDVTVYSARSMIHQERPDTLISASMSIARTNNIRYLRFA
jgi:hypothetical protein